jgi:hypothetical protein
LEFTQIISNRSFGTQAKKSPNQFKGSHTDVNLNSEEESSSAVNTKPSFKNQESINQQINETTAFPDYEGVEVQFSILSELLLILTNFPVVHSKSVTRSLP